MTAVLPGPEAAMVKAPRFPALGTYVELAVTEQAALPAAEGLLRRHLEALDLACSRFRADSELARLNAATGVTHRVSPLLRQAVGVALRAAEETRGLVDPTVGRDLVIAGYDRDFAALYDNGPASLPQLPVRPSWRDVELDLVGGTLRVPDGCLLDLGATAKALGADLAATDIAASLGAGALVSLGGDVATSGPAPAGGWAVRTSARRDGGPDAETVLMDAGGLATSSPDARRWRRNGQDAHHIIDPRTGRPASYIWRAVTVAAATCVEANTAATAAVVLGTEARDWLSRVGNPARLVHADGTVVRQGGWPEPGRWSR